MSDWIHYWTLNFVCTSDISRVPLVLSLATWNTMDNVHHKASLIEWLCNFTICSWIIPNGKLHELLLDLKIVWLNLLFLKTNYVANYHRYWFQYLHSIFLMFFYLPFSLSEFQYVKIYKFLRVNFSSLWGLYTLRKLITRVWVILDSVVNWSTTLSNVEYAAWIPMCSCWVKNPCLECKFYTLAVMIISSHG